MCELAVSSPLFFFVHYPLVELKEMHVIAFFVNSLPFVLTMEEVMNSHTL